MDRDEQLKEQAVAGLQEYYECLHDGTFVGEVKAAVKVPDTGNDQADYESVRDQVEQICMEREGDN